LSHSASIFALICKANLDKKPSPSQLQPSSAIHRTCGDSGLERDKRDTQGGGG
jgi:hypothetical protein